MLTEKCVLENDRIIACVNIIVGDAYIPAVIQRFRCVFSEPRKFVCDSIADDAKQRYNDCVGSMMKKAGDPGDTNKIMAYRESRRAESEF